MRGVATAIALGCALACSAQSPDKASSDRAAPDKAVPQADPNPADAAPPTTEAFAIEHVAKYPVPGTSIPSSVRWTPDGSAITFLYSAERTLTRQLYVLDPKSGERRVLFKPPEGGATEENLSPEEKLQRERRRERGLGVTRYRWARETNRLLVPLRGDLWVQDGLDGQPRKLVDAEDKPALDATFSRDAKWVAYVQDDELFVVPFEGGTPKQITKGARGTGKTHGLPEYIAQEEMGRHRGYWWSHDSTALAYTEVDETHIPAYRISHQGRDAPSHEDHRYPFAGEPNAKVRLGVVKRGGGRTVWMDLAMEGEPADDLYLARVHWMPDGSLMAQVENRMQSRLDLVRFDPKSGRGKVVLTERSDVWINLDGSFRAFEEAKGELEGGFLWASERTGFKHLYVYGKDGELVRALTEGEWMVDGVSGLDEAGGLVYFTATKDGPTERHVYRVPLSGGSIDKLTEAAGSHGATFDRKAVSFVDSHSSLGGPYTLTIREAGGKQMGTIEYDPDPRVAELDLKPPTLVTLETRDGVRLHGAVYKPTGEGPFPTLVSVYGGPHAQRVVDSWGLVVDMRAQYLRGLGYLVFKLDNRGSARRGLAFEGAIRHDMGNLEVQDQVDGVRWLAQQGLADPKRVGMYGWSYGGYMSAMGLARAADTFHAAVAGAPVTHWDSYDTHYTERYMGTPQSNAEGYEQSSVMAHLEKMEGSLLLVHGLIDENVHFRHTARLIDALIKQRKDHELLLFPDERHMPRREADRVYMEERIVAFFDEKVRQRRVP